MFLLLLLGWQFTLFAQSQIKVMSYNIRNSNAADGPNKWKYRKENVGDLIKQVDPDVLGTQEVLLDQYNDLKKRLPSYSVFGAGRNNGKHAGEHSCIFYKTEKYKLLNGGNFWLSETPSKPGSKSWDAAITRICTWIQLKEKQSGKSFFVFNTHFDHRGQLARVNSAKLLIHVVDSICGDLPVIVTGDFNFSPESPGYAILTDTFNTITLKDAYTPDQPNYTDCGFNIENTDCHRIDYIFLNQHFIPVKYQLHKNNNGKYYPSDHLTISTSLTF